LIGVGVVGYGYAGRVFHCPLITQVEGLRLVAVSSRDAQRREQARQHWNVRTYAQPEELLTDEQVELVVIATPHHTHHALGKMALQAGKHVVIDKPFTIIAAEADDLIHEARKRNLLLSVFHNRRWDWDYLTVRKVMEEGLLGEIWQVESCVGRYGHSSRWRSQRESMGSLLHDWGAHLIDQVIQLMGLPTQVMAWRHFRVWQSDVESFIRAVLDYGDGRTFTVEVNYLRAAERPRWYVLGDRGGLVKYGLDPQEEALRTGNIGAAVEPPEHRARVWLYEEGQVTERTIDSVRGDWSEYYRNIAGVLLHGEELAVKPEQARQVIRVIEAALQSAETSQPVRLS
jgi:scyllo-inositol 2-dehydrogenase (NADP+)